MAKFLEKLPLICCDEEVLLYENIRWMWEVKELTSFLDWFGKYTDISNYINDRQQRQCEDCTELNERELNEALEEYGIDAQSILLSNLSDLDLELCDNEVDLLRAENDAAVELEALLSEEGQKLLNREANAEASLKAAQVACQKEGQSLMKINVPLKAAISNLFGNLSKTISTWKDSEDPDVQNCCISNKPLEGTLNVCAKFCEFASLCLKRKFAQPSYSEKDSFYELISILEGGLLEQPPSQIANGYKMWKAECSRIEKHGSLMSYNAVIHHLESFSRSSSLEKLSPLHMKIELLKLKNEVLRLSEDIDLILKHEVSSVVEDIVLCNITRVVEKITKGRIERRKMALRNLFSVGSIANKFVLVLDALWVLFKLESQRCKSGKGLLLEVSDFFTEELNRHKATMGGLNMIMNHDKLNKDALRPGQVLLLNTLQKLVDSTTLALDDDSGNGTLLGNHGMDSECIQISDILDSSTTKYLEYECSILKLHNELINGPTRKPSLVQKDIVLAMQDVESHLQQCSDKSKSLATLFSAKQLSFQKSPIIQNRRLLWAWFLVAEDRLKAALELAKNSQKKKNVHY